MNFWQPKDGYVFVVTYGRSGSTLLQTVLQSIDGYFIRGENNHALLPLFRSYKRVHQARYVHGAKEIGETGPWYGADEISPTHFGEALTNAFVQEVLRPPRDARVVGFKEIRFHEANKQEFIDYLDFMARYFAPAKFIFNMRKWEDVSKSGWWKTMNPEKVKADIERCDSWYKNYAEAHPERSFLLQYEDYAGKPEQLEGLFEFLGEPFDLEKLKAVTERRLPH